MSVVAVGIGNAHAVILRVLRDCPSRTVPSVAIDICVLPFNAAEVIPL